MPELSLKKTADSFPTFRETEENVLDDLFDDVDFDFDLKGYHSDATNLLLEFIQQQVLKEKFRGKYEKALETYQKMKAASGGMNRSKSSENLRLFFENKRKIVKEMLHKKKELMEEKMKTPPFLRTSDKLGFTVSISCLLFTQWILLLHPQWMYLWYTCLLIPLLTWRYFSYSKQKYQYFMLDFCYFAQSILLIWMYFLPQQSGLFQIVFAMCNGPLAFGIVMWRNSLVFHEIDKCCSVFIHLFPPLITYCARWFPRGNDFSSVCSDPECNTSSYQMFFLPLGFYVVWQVLYLLQTEVIDKKKLEKDMEIMTTVRYWTYVKPHSALIWVKSKGYQIKPLILLIVLQFFYTMVCFLPVIPIYHSFFLHSIYLMALFFVCVWNGANFYFEVFAETYAKRVRRCLDDASNSNPPSPVQETCK